MRIEDGHIEDATFQLDVGDDGKTIVLVMTARPSICCKSCTRKFMLAFVDKLAEPEPENSDLRH